MQICVLPVSTHKSNSTISDPSFDIMKKTVAHIEIEKSLINLRIQSPFQTNKTLFDKKIRGIYIQIAVPQICKCYNFSMRLILSKNIFHSLYGSEAFSSEYISVIGLYYFSVEVFGKQIQQDRASSQLEQNVIERINVVKLTLVLLIILQVVTKILHMCIIGTRSVYYNRYIHSFVKYTC